MDELTSEQLQQRFDALKALARSRGPSLPQKVADYIQTRRNADKRNYARAYARWITLGEQGDSPEYPGLSYMAAQAVRMELRAAFG